MEQVNIQDDICWVCGKKFNENKTMHHGIPKCLKPKKNILVPICESCHEEINNIDFSATILPFTYHIKSSVEELNSKSHKLLDMVSHISKMQKIMEEALGRNKK